MLKNLGDDKEMLQKNIRKVKWLVHLSFFVLLLVVFLQRMQLLDIKLLSSDLVYICILGYFSMLCLFLVYFGLFKNTIYYCGEFVVMKKQNFFYYYSYNLIFLIASILALLELLNIIIS